MNTRTEGRYCSIEKAACCHLAAKAGVLGLQVSLRFLLVELDQPCHCRAVVDEVRVEQRVGETAADAARIGDSWSRPAEHGLQHERSARRLAARQN